MKKKKEIRIAQIIEAALDEFILKGYDNTSMESIARRANLSKGGLYHHFSSKAEILFAANIKFMEPVNAFIEKTDNSDNIADGLRQFINDYISYWKENKRELSLYFFTMNISFNNKQIMSYYQAFTSTLFDTFEAFFRKGEQKGIFRERDARSHAVALISSLDGYLAYMLIDPTLNTEKVIAEIQSSFINDILTQTI